MEFNFNSSDQNCDRSVAKPGRLGKNQICEMRQIALQCGNSKQPAFTLDNTAMVEFNNELKLC